MRILRASLALSTCALLASCGTLESWKASILGEDPPKKPRAPASVAPAVAEVPKPSSRKADPFDGTGPYYEASLWNQDTQDNFYFSKNILHKVGDILIVKVEPEVNDALNLKIAAALGRSGLQQVVADEAGKAAGDAVSQKVGTALGNQNIGNAAGAAVADRTIASLDSKPRYVDVDEMSVRITELLPRNSYRIEGSKRVFVKTTPYTLRYSGVVRDDDLGPSSVIASSKVIDSKMEMVK